MTSYIEIAGDPTKWWAAEQFSASQLTGQAVSVKIASPVNGFLVISARAAGVAVFETNQAMPALVPIQVPGIYVPSAAGLAVGHAGYQLPASPNLGNLVSQVTNLMTQGSRQTITLGGNASGGTLVLNGATLSFAVVFQGAPVPMPPPPIAEGVVPHH
jgi:hypothetical protein